ncbi:MAG TPA: DUF4382 domain-containing protein [Gemmatimonadaceae bacterium]|jgi:hypothetical protein
MMSKMTRRATLVSVIACAAVLVGGCADDDTTSLGSTGRLTVRLTDAPSLIDSIQRVDIFIERVDGRLAVASDAEIAAHVDTASVGGWVTLATPNASFNLLALRNGTTRTLHDASLPTGSYNAFRIVIDPSKSSVTLKSGRVLTHNSSPGILFPSVTRSAIRISPSKPVQIVGGRTANLIVDFDVNTSLVQRGNSIERDGLLFRPRITATVVDAGVVTATLRLVNLTRTELTLWQGGDPLSDARRLQPETDSPCMVVHVLEPITVTALGFDAIARFAPDLVPGASYLLVVFRDTTDRFRIVTLPTRFVIASGRSGLRVFNATGLAAGLDVSVAAVGAALGPATFIDVLADSLSPFVDLPAGLSRILITNHGSSETLLDIPPQDLRAGERLTLVLLSVRGLPVPRFFIVPSC